MSYTSSGVSQFVWVSCQTHVKVMWLSHIYDMQLVRQRAIIIGEDNTGLHNYTLLEIRLTKG